MTIKQGLVSLVLILIMTGCIRLPNPFEKGKQTTEIVEEEEQANNKLSTMLIVGCFGIAAAVGVAVANMGNGLKSILIGVICGAGTLVGLATMLQNYSKQIGLIMTVAFCLVIVMVFVSLFIKKGFLTLPFMKGK